MYRSLPLPPLRRPPVLLTDHGPQIHSWLGGLLPEWSYENWTSKLRRHANYKKFTKPEKYWADFTYHDRHGQLLQALTNAGAEISPDWRTETRYHLEVKSTPAECGATFYVSKDQVRLVSCNLYVRHARALALTAKP